MHGADEFLDEGLSRCDRHRCLPHGPQVTSARINSFWVLGEVAVHNGTATGAEAGTLLFRTAEAKRISGAQLLRFRAEDVARGGDGGSRNSVNSDCG